MPSDRLGAQRYAAAALIAGLVSGALALSVETASLWRLVFLGLAPLPLFASGLSAGPLSSLAAGLAGAVLVTAVVGSVGGGVYLAAIVIPSAILVWQALRSVQAGEARKVWYSGGNLLLWLAGLGIAGVLALIGYFAVSHGGLASAIGERFELTPFVSAMLARIAPGLAVAAWMVVIAADSVVAEWLVAQFGLAVRPPIDIRRLSLPVWIGPILMVAGLAGAILREGTIGMVCLNSAIVLVVPFVFLGLALVHALVGRVSYGPALIAAMYVVLLGSPALLGWRALLIFTLMLAGLGSADQLIDFRDLRGLRTGMRRK
ncbi:MAG: hypothetical protein JWM91_196 [Rhodospirillales bacterium]|nr:hypothetical protein [Rhodospirillales bacterium]